MTRKLPRGAYLLVQRYFRHGVGVQSAALAFYLMKMRKGKIINSR